MEYLLVAAVSAGAALLTFFSGFGLGTILSPFFAFFLPIESAIAATAIVHFSNNIFKTGLIGKHIQMQVLLKFGLAALPASVLGAWLLTFLSAAPPIMLYTMYSIQATVTPVKLISGILMIIFSITELNGWFEKKEIPGNRLLTGGLLSGFFGGLSGNQGAFRSMFLLHSGLTKEVYVATGTAVALIVDAGRLFVYGKNNLFNSLPEHIYPLLYVAIIAAFLGSYLGKKVLKKITIRSVQIVAASCICIVGILLSLGIL